MRQISAFQAIFSSFFRIICIAIVCKCVAYAQPDNPPPPRSEEDRLIREGHDYLQQQATHKTAAVLRQLQASYSRLHFGEQIGYWILAANYHDSKAQIDSALYCYKKALQISGRIPKDAPPNFHLHLSMGHFYLHWGIPDVAASFFRKAISLGGVHSPARLLTDAQVGLVRAHLDLKQLHTAKKYARQACGFTVEGTSTGGSLTAFFWLGVVYQEFKQHDSARVCFEKVATFPNDSPRDAQLKTDASNRIAVLYLADKNTKKATEIFQKNSAAPNAMERMKAWIGLVNIYTLKEDYQRARAFLDSAEYSLRNELQQFPTFLRAKSIDRFYREALALFEKAQDENLFKEYQTAHLRFLDSLQNTQAKAQIETLRKLTLYTGNYYDQHIKVSEAEARFSRLLLWAVSCLSGLLFWIVWQHYRHRIANHQKDIEFKTAEAIILQYELEEKTRRQQTLQKEIASQRADITDLALENTLKSKQTQELLGELKDIKVELRLNEKSNQNLDNLIKDLRNKINANERRDMLLENIDKVNHEFYERLQQKSQDLTQSEKELCGLIRLQLNGKEIAVLRNITPKAVKMARYRLRKKLNLPSEDDMYAFMAMV